MQRNRKLHGRDDNREGCHGDVQSRQHGHCDHGGERERNGDLRPYGSQLLLRELQRNLPDRYIRDSDSEVQHWLLLRGLDR